jgi:4,5-DOPA dioxygenase extradiol
MNSSTQQLSSSSAMPLLFLGHGSPMNAIQENEFVAGFRIISAEIKKPNAILCISAHWETKGTFVTAMENPKTIHDFGGFPRELYDVNYPAPGAPFLAEDIRQLIQMTPIELDYKWGLDHGTWSVIKHLYPQADIPIIQLSLDFNKTPEFHYKLAKELSLLREKGVLIIGSGNIVHNLRLVAWNKLNEEFAYDWAIEANDKTKQFIIDNDHQALINYKLFGKAFDVSIPTSEHFLPLLYILALKNNDEEIKIFNDKIVGGSMSMTSLKFGN